MNLRRYLLLLLTLYSFSGWSKGLAKIPEAQIAVYGFVLHQGDKAVVISGSYRYTLPWREFLKVNVLLADSDRRQRVYKLATANLTVKKEAPAGGTR